LSVKIVDIRGTVIKTILIEKNIEGYVDWEINDIETGLYFYSLCANDHPIETGKLFIVK